MGDRVMSELSATLPVLEEALGSLISAERTVTALRLVAIQLAMERNYRTLLATHVFSRHADLQRKIDKKRASTAQSHLLSPDGFLVLSIIWKESHYVSDKHLAAAGMSRSFEDEKLNCHSIAVSICSRPKEVAATNTRVRNIILAAVDYELVSRTAVSRTLNEIDGTDLLHESMLKLTRENNKLIQQLSFSSCDTSSSTNL